MKRLAILLIPILLLLSCRKTTAGSGARSFTGPNPAIEGALLIREVSHFPAGDSFVTTYQYDAALRLTAMLRSAPPALNLNSNTYYARDDQERIIRRIIMADSIADTMYVFYASPALGIVSYTIDQSGTSYRDSAAYTYRLPDPASSGHPFRLPASPNHRSPNRSGPTRRSPVLPRQLHDLCRPFPH